MQEPEALKIPYQYQEVNNLDEFSAPAFFRIKQAIFRNNGFIGGNSAD